MEKFDEVVSTFKETKKVSDTLVLARNHPGEFYRILRKKFDGQNANTETYGVRKDYKGNDVTLAYQKELIEKLKTDTEFRYRFKNDREKTNITDAPGFGSVRISPPFEDPTFDREYFEFLNNLVEDGDNVYDFGGGMSPFLYFLDHGNKILVDKADIPDVMEPLGIKYIDSDLWLMTHMQPMKPENDLSKQKNSVLFCFHTLEHTNNPEELIRFFSRNFGVFVFATPNEELIETSIYHHIFMQVGVMKQLFGDSVAFLRTSKHRPLDIHGIVVNSPKKWSYMKNNLFFNRNFKLYKEM